MAEFIQVHGLFDYSLSNPNRGRDNEPKRAMIGNVERQRISSQCLKRTWRTSDLFIAAFGGKLGVGNLGLRTKELGSSVYESLMAGGVPEASADQWTRVLAAIFGVAKPENTKKKDSKDHFQNETLFFCTPEEKGALDVFVQKIVAEKLPPPNAKGKEELEKEAAKIRPQILKSETSAVDVALFGRMFAQDKDFSIEGSMQVAHALTVVGYEADPDFFTAVDDIKSSDDAQGEDRGSGHLGNFTMGGGVYYCYASINRTALLQELKDEELVKKVCRVFTEVFMTVFAKAKGNSCAQQSRAFYGRVERGDKMPRNLSTAFLEAITERNVAKTSIQRLESHATAMDKVYGPCCRETASFSAIAGMEKGSLAEVLDLVGK